MESSAEPGICAGQLLHQAQNHMHTVKVLLPDAATSALAPMKANTSQGACVCAGCQEVKATASLCRPAAAALPLKGASCCNEPTYAARLHWQVSSSLCVCVCAVCQTGGPAGHLCGPAAAERDGGGAGCQGSRWPGRAAVRQAEGCGAAWRYRRDPIGFPKCMWCLQSHDVV